MKFFIQLHHYMVIVMLGAVLGSFNNNFAMKRPSLNTKQQDLCALLPDLDPNGPQKDYDQFVQKMTDQKLTTCLCIMANRDKQSREGIKKINKTIKEVTNGAVAITMKEYDREVVLCAEKSNNQRPATPHTEPITFKDSFAPEIIKAIKDTYTEYNLWFDVEVVKSYNKRTQIKTETEGVRTEIFTINPHEVPSNYAVAKGIAAHELAGHGKLGHGLYNLFYGHLINRKFAIKNIVITEAQRAELNNTIDEHCIKNEECDADQIPCACGSLSSAYQMMAYKKYDLKHNNDPESSTHLSDRNRYNDVLRILRLKKAESTLGGIPDILPQNPIKKAFSSKWFT